MTLSNYAELQTAIADFLNREDLAGSIPTFIRLAEAQMERELDHWKMERRSEVLVDDRYTALPCNFRNPIRLYITGANKALEPITQSQMQDKRYSNADVTGKPRFYCITAGEVELFPTPSSEALEMYYVANLPKLSDTNTSNWLLDEAPDAYLYGALLQSAPYLQDDQRIAVWTSLFTAAVSGLNAVSQDAKWGGQGLKSR
ncbi:hypothetical protein HGG71_05660 [Rhodobacteraceae bacterium R_SAG2]|nr:hypothetical protein [Rhodobacteraceae bacterium R_SAG2]